MAKFSFKFNFKDMVKSLFKLSAFKIAILFTLVMSLYFLYTTIYSGGGNFLTLLDKKWVDIIQKNRKVQPHVDTVAIATVDSKSVDKYGRWPWPRTRIAQLVDALNEYNVKAFGFDIVFSEPEQPIPQMLTDKFSAEFKHLGFGGAKAKQYLTMLETTKTNLDGDTKLGAALSKKPDNVLGYFFQNDPQAILDLTDKDKAEGSARIVGSEVAMVDGVVPKGLVPEGLFPEANIDKIVHGGLVAGFFNMIPDPEDGTVRRVHLIYEHNGNYYPNLDLQLIRLYMDLTPIIIHSDPGAGIYAIEVGEKVIYPNQDGSILLNYKGPAATFKQYSIYDIIERNLPKSDLEGKIILIGATEVGIYDLRTAPVSSEYPGVEVHATLIDNILSDTYFQFSAANDAYTLIIMIVLGLGVGFLLPRLKHIYGTVLAFAVVGAYLFAHDFMVNHYYTFTSAMFPTAEILLIWGSVILYQFLVSDRDKRFIKGAFQQYLSPTVINQLIDNPNMLKLGGERRVCTAFFSDVAGFSTISEKLSPEDLVTLLNTYLTEMSNLIMQSGGTVDKYEGDAIIAFWGAPIPHEDHAIRACMVSLDQQARLAELRVKWKAEGKPELTCRIGVNTGPMVVGNMGSENRFDYTMMGNSVNLASRLEGANKNYGTHLMISEMTYEPAKEAIEVRELDLIRVVGIKTAVRIYELVGRKGQVAAENIKAYRLFEEGLTLYRQQQWDGAVAKFHETMGILPEDPPSKSFIERCETFKAHPPGAEWDGVFTASSK